MSKEQTLTSKNGTTLIFDLPDDVQDTSHWKVAMLLPFSYSLPYTGVGYTQGDRIISASFTSDRKVEITLPRYSTNHKNGVDDEFALILSDVTFVLVYIE